jgi:hypothetical protein
MFFNLLGLAVVMKFDIFAARVAVLEHWVVEESSSVYCVVRDVVC